MIVIYEVIVNFIVLKLFENVTQVALELFLNLN